MRKTLLALLIVPVALTACGRDERATSTSVPEAPALTERPTLADVITRHAPELMAMPGVQMVYESLTESGEPCLKIGVDVLTDALRARLPQELEGWPVVVVESGVIRPLQRD